MTRQEFAKEADMGTLISRYNKTGLFYDPLTRVKSERRVPFFGDCTSVPSFDSAINQVADAQLVFSGFPPEVRARYGSLEAFVAHSCTPEGLKEIRAMFAAHSSTPVPPIVPPAPVTPAPVTPAPVSSGGAS
jgi:hypothetical protein